MTHDSGNKLRLSCADFTFPMLPQEQALDLIALLGVTGVDLGFFPQRSQVTPDDIFADTRGVARRYANLLAARGLEMADIFYMPAPDFENLAPNHPDAGQRGKSREIFEQMLEFVARCNARHMSALPGVVWPGETEAACIARAAEELEWRATRAASMGIKFSVECHVGSVAPTPAATAELLRQAPALTLTLDYCHFIRQGFVDLDVEPLLARASHLHARGARAERLQTSVAQNTIDYARIARLLRERNYDGYICLEYVWTEWERCNEVDNLCETILLRDLLRAA